MTQSDSDPNPTSTPKKDNKKPSIDDHKGKDYHRKRKNRRQRTKNKQTLDDKKETQKNRSKNETQGVAGKIKNDSHNVKKLQNRNNSGKIQRSSKNRNKNHFRLPVNKSQQELSRRRENEISHCRHVLSNRSFKLLKRGQYVTSYGFTRNQKLLGIPNCKLIIDIPMDYPRSPMKLDYRSNAQYDDSLEEKLSTLTENFNFKSTQLLAEGEPIISQLNYLVEKAEILAQRDYRVIDKHERDFFSKFA